MSRGALVLFAASATFVPCFRARTTQAHARSPNTPIGIAPQLHDELGRGQYGCVHRGNWNGTEVAVKTLHSMDGSSAAVAAKSGPMSSSATASRLAERLDTSEFRKELEILLSLRHPCIAQCLGDRSFVCIEGMNASRWFTSVVVSQFQTKLGKVAGFSKVL